MTAMRAPGGRLANVLLGVYLALFFLFLFLPILMAVESSFNLDRFVGLPWKGFTLEWYRGIVDTPDVLPSLRRSVVVGLCVATASVVLGFLAAYSLTRVAFPGKDAYVMAVISPLAVPWI
ncbi:MAG TPA: hypothetical protein VFQ80_04375, partial [Thermomicrobiales bacterium]|nr:hypothetical protein [Thermomicrobiales bacterium]